MNASIGGFTEGETTMHEVPDPRSLTGAGPVSPLLTSDGLAFQPRQIVAGRYEIISRLCCGGTGEVWLAHDLKLRVDIALKALRRATPKAMQALRREARTARQVFSANVCRIFDLVVDGNDEFISMEYIDGITLLALLYQEGSLDLCEARGIARQFLAGLEAIHQAGLVHCDLKPENIMITRTGRVVVMDFGIAKHTSQSTGTISGTLPYMAPERLAGHRVDARSDVFSAGVVLAEMIHPGGILNQQIRESIWITVRRDPLQLAESPWKAVIAHAVAANPLDRFPSALALARAL